MKKIIVTQRANLQSRRKSADKYNMEESRIDYKSLESQRHSELQEELNRQLAEKTRVGHGDNLRQSVLGQVVAGHYANAKETLEEFIVLKAEYPSFKVRVHPYVIQCHHVIDAIRAKRDFPGITSLPKSKQQEIFEKVGDHFDELKFYLRKIESVDRDIRLSDLRSTVWVLKAASFALAAILSTAFVMDVVFRIGYSFNIVLDESVAKVLAFVQGLF